MQIIQSIRDRGAVIVIIVISLSLIGFILMDSKQGGNSMFGSLSTKVGKVNGDAIELAYFNKRVKQAEDQQQQNSGNQTFQVREQMWNQIIAEKIFFTETEKLGIDFTSKELSSILLSNDQNNPLLREQGMTDPATGKLDVSKAQAALSNIKKLKGEQRDLVNVQIVDPLKLSTSVNKYSGLLNASVYYPTWMQEKDNAEAKNFATISFVNIPYSEISDSTIKVTDAEVNDYVQKHKDLFKQEEGRMISYATFSQLANKEDSAKAKAQAEELKASFQADSNAKNFVARNSSANDFTDKYLTKPRITSSAIDSIIAAPTGSVYGPYLDKGSYVLAKVLGTKPFPDSVKARHILIPLADANGKEIRPDSTAKKLADSIHSAILGGADFAALALKYSSDGSKTVGGDLGPYYGYEKMVPEFRDYTFENPVGSKGVVKSQFGYHVIEVLGQRNFVPSYNIAFVAKEINPSDKTINDASLEATKASIEKTKPAFEKYLNKNGVHLTEVPTPVKENDYAIGNTMQDARQLIRWAFEAKVGDVSDPYNIGDQFVVAVLDKVLKEGVKDAATARPGCEVIIRNKKKADMIIKKIGANPTLEAAAAAYGKQIQQAGADSSITLTSQIINGLGVEPEVIGASFNKEYQSKPSPAIAGASSVYVIKVNSVQPKTADMPEVTAQQAAGKLNSLRGQVNNWYEGLKKQASIKDNRSDYF